MTIQACADLVARADPDRFLTVMAAPVAARRILLPIYAFNVEVSRAPWMTQEPAIAEIRLQWWRDALEEIAKGGVVRRHDVVTPLAEVLDAEAAGLLDRLIAARRWDAYPEPFEDRAHFDDYIAQTSGTLMWVAARALGASDPGPVRTMGHASGLAAWLRAVPELESLGRYPLVDGRSGAVKNLAVQGAAMLKAARSNRQAVPRQAVPALLAGWRAGTTLKRAVRDPGLVAAGRLEESDAARRAALIWRSFSGRW